ncbi:MAG: carbohydrate ABC transporter permease [Candidatus Omnitrophota bacterium]
MITAVEKQSIMGHEVGIRKDSLTIKTFIYLFLIAGAVIMAVPYVWMFVTSIKPLAEIQSYPPSFIVKNPTLEPYRDLFKIVPMMRYLFNSLFVAGTVTLFNVFATSLAGYAFAKHKFWGRDKLFFILLGSLMIPWQVNVIPGFVIVKKLGWLNTYRGLIIPSMAWCAFGIFLNRQYIYSIPDDLIDAAKIDGCSEFMIYRKVILPLIKPVVATLAIFTFLQQWNNFVWPLVIIHTSNMRTIPLVLAILTGQFGSNFAIVMAGAVVSTLPMLVVYLLFQKYIIKGVAMTGLKGYAGRKR